MPLAPRGIVRRWAVVGRTPDHWECTTLIDLPAADRAHLVVHLAAVSRYSLSLDRSSVRMLLDTIAAGVACAVPAQHAEHGECLLGLRPARSWRQPSRPAGVNRPCSMELYLQLSDTQIVVCFRSTSMVHLATALTAAVAEMSGAG